jgi:hypothetical protein
VKIVNENLEIVCRVMSGKRPFTATSQPQISRVQTANSPRTKPKFSRCETVVPFREKTENLVNERLFPFPTLPPAVKSA